MMENRLRIGVKREERSYEENVLNKNKEESLVLAIITIAPWETQKDEKNTAKL